VFCKLNLSIKDHLQRVNEINKKRLNNISELARIRSEYSRREQEIASNFYSISKLANLFSYQQRVRAVLCLLTRMNVLPLSEANILEVGCGGGSWLIDFESWGAKRANLAGIELYSPRALIAQTRLCALRDANGNIVTMGADIREGDASCLPWVSRSFDIVLLSLVFTSILDVEMKRKIAQEIARVLRPSGIILWYDFFCNSPHNPSVRGIRAGEIRSLFPGFDVCLKRVTLAPPLARIIVPLSWICSVTLEKIGIFNTHYLGVLRKREDN